MSRRPPRRPPIWKTRAVVHARLIGDLNRLRRQAEAFDAEQAAKAETSLGRDSTTVESAPARHGPERS
jgi:hypothetical protein